METSGSYSKGMDRNGEKLFPDRKRKFGAVFYDSQQQDVPAGYQLRGGGGPQALDTIVQQSQEAETDAGGWIDIG